MVKEFFKSNDKLKCYGKKIVKILHLFLIANLRQFIGYNICIGHCIWKIPSPLILDYFSWFLIIFPEFFENFSKSTLVKGYQFIKWLVEGRFFIEKIH